MFDDDNDDYRADDGQDYATDWAIANIEAYLDSLFADYTDVWNSNPAAAFEAGKTGYPEVVAVNLVDVARYHSLEDILYFLDCQEIQECCELLEQTEESVHF